MDPWTIIAALASTIAVVATAYSQSLRSQIHDAKKREDRLIVALTNHLQLKNDTDAAGAEIWRELRADLKQITLALGGHSSVQESLVSAISRLHEITERSHAKEESSLETMSQLIKQLLKAPRPNEE